MERISELHVNINRNFYNKREKKKPEKINRTKYLKTLGQLQKIKPSCKGNTRRWKRERNGRNIWSNYDWECPKINVRHQTKYPENTNQDKFFKYLGISYLNCRK